jgi:hypothetical protein
METLQLSQEHELDFKEFHALYDGVVEATWDLRIQDEYFDTYEKLSKKRPGLSQSELEAAITKNTAEQYADTMQFSPTKKAGFLLFASAPEWAIHEAKLYKHEPAPHSKKLVSEFNDKLRGFVTLHLEADQEQSSSRLVEYISTANIDSGFSNVSEIREIMDRVIGGIRTEVGFEQLFQYASIPFQRGNTQQDLVSIDYLVPVLKKTLKFDVKSNLDDTGSETLPYARINEDHYRLLRLFGSSDFKNNSFKLREESMQNKAEGTRQLIQHLAKIG